MQLVSSGTFGIEQKKGGSNVEGLVTSLTSAMGSCASAPKREHEELERHPSNLVPLEVQPRPVPITQTQEQLVASSLMAFVDDEQQDVTTFPAAAASTHTPAMETSFVASLSRREFTTRSLVGGSPLPDMRETEVSPTHRPLSSRSGPDPQRSVTSSKSNSRNQDPSLVAASMSTWSQSTVDRYAGLVFPPLVHHSGSAEQDEEDDAADAARNVDPCREASSAVRKEERSTLPQENPAENA